MNLNDLELVPKEDTFYMTAVIYDTSSNNYNRFKSYACSERAFKQTLISKIKMQGWFTAVIENLNTDKERESSILSWRRENTPHICGMSEEEYIKGRVSFITRRLDHINTMIDTYGVDYYLNQIDQTAGEYISLMLYSQDEWCLND